MPLDVAMGAEWMADGSLLTANWAALKPTGTRGDSEAEKVKQDVIAVMKNSCVRLKSRLSMRGMLVDRNRWR